MIMSISSPPQLRRPSRGRIARAAAAFAVLAWGAGRATAQIVQSVGTTDIGNVVSAPSTDTVFRISASTGLVTKQSGDGVRLSTGTTRSLVTVYCQPKTDCDRQTLKIEVGNIGTPTNRARALTNFTAESGTATITAPTGTDPITFSTTNAIRSRDTQTFYIGMDFPIAGNKGGLPTGVSTSGFYVYVCAPAATCTPSAGSTGLAIASVLRGIAISLDNDLVFGSVLRPLSGTGSVSLDPLGQRTFANGAIGLAIPTPKAASYTVSGEGGQLISVSIPPTFTMTRSGGSETLTVTTLNNVQSSPALSNDLGKGGTYTFSVGGSFPLDSSVPLGLYTGTFAVTVQYN
jgi:hypothetical protein